MAQAVYVLTTLMSSVDGAGKSVKEWRPVAVVTDSQTADQWTYESAHNDWIPFELDDLGLTGLAEHSVTEFKAKKPVPIESQTEQAMKNLTEINDRLIDIVERLAIKYKEQEVLKIVNSFKRETEAEKQKPSQKIKAQQRFSNNLFRKEN